MTRYSVSLFDLDLSALHLLQPCDVQESVPGNANNKQSFPNTTTSASLAAWRTD